MSQISDQISAVIDKDDDRNWVALARVDGVLKVFYVNDDDAWDYDIEKRLVVSVEPQSAESTYCKIVAKHRVL